MDAARKLSMDMYGMRLGPAGAEQAVHSWSALPDPHNDEQILPGLQELLGGHSTCEHSLHYPLGFASLAKQARVVARADPLRRTMTPCQ